MRQKKILKILAVCFSTVMLTQPASAAAPQQTAQGAAGADGIPIGTAMGEDEEVIFLPEKIGGFMESATAKPEPEPPDPPEESRCKVIPFEKVV